MSEKKADHKPHKKASPLHATLPFVRAAEAGVLINLTHIVTVSLPVDGDAKQPLTLTLVNGSMLTLTDDDAVAVVAALGECCDVS